MRSRSFITQSSYWACVLLILFLARHANAAMRVAVLTPDDTPFSAEYAEALTLGLTPTITVLDHDMAMTAYRVKVPDAPFNMSTEEAKRLASMIGCDFFIVTKSALQRRNAAGRGEYFEAFAVLYTVSSRTGRLLDWELRRSESPDPKKAAEGLLKEAPRAAASLAVRTRSAISAEIIESPVQTMEKPPEQDSPFAKSFRAPIPFFRIKPQYTTTAASYEVAASVEIEVDLDAGGHILRTEIKRWAGYGLDEAVDGAVQKMNWRPAERNGKFLPMRFLLRYNFKKVEKDQT